MEHKLHSDAAGDEKAHRPREDAVMTDYAPEHYAFRFPNALVNHVWSARIPPRVGRRYEISTSGRCGGMAFASLDFFHFRMLVPPVTSSDFLSSVVPPDGHPLADYIYTRQLHSMLTKVGGLYDGVRYLRWSGQRTATILAKTAVEEQKVVASIDQGQPVVLGLIRATSRSLKAQGQNHQVVCYGYRFDASGHLEFYIYEPVRASSNSPYEVILKKANDVAHSAFPYQEDRADRIDRWRGFFVAHYRPRSPDCPGLTSRSAQRGPARDDLR